MTRNEFESAVEAIIGEHDYNICKLAKFDINKKLELVAFACFDNPELHTTHASQVNAVKQVRANLQEHGCHGLTS